MGHDEFRHDVHAGMVAELEKSDFQNLAHLAELFAGGLLPQPGGCIAELFAEGIGEVTVTGEAQLQRELGEIGFAFRELFEGSTLMSGLW